MPRRDLTGDSVRISRWTTCTSIAKTAWS